ncbi:hypothetical protein [Dubosiella newyorkensis]|uniref:hypothetical protein n=1 Tax=Dubosiella newyorkensis TaxID=1862672 RepID=UPI0023F2E1D4|nr:hypothetical protein [Dubosiella newyorkensis]
MWNELNDEKKEQYKRYILGFASLTECFKQKKDESQTTIPMVHSKYQEKAFQRAFDATCEDVGNTSYDASLIQQVSNDSEIRYLIGIKTFQYKLGESFQKIAQFKKNHGDWIDRLEQIRKSENLKERRDLQKSIAEDVSRLRNLRIDSSRENLKGFNFDPKDSIKEVYHILSPLFDEKEGPIIKVGEKNLEKIDIQKIEILEEEKQKVENFIFSDGKNVYKFTSADSQLWMKFKDIQEMTGIIDWSVQYVEDPFKVFETLGSKKDDQVIESHSWRIGKNGKIERYSGFNAFNAVSSKNPKQLEKKLLKLKEKYRGKIDDSFFDRLDRDVKMGNSEKERPKKEEERNRILENVEQIGNADFLRDVRKLICRDPNEMYIGIPKAKKFHKLYPDFFVPDLGNKIITGADKKNRKKQSFRIVFEPSKDIIEAYLTQDSGKAVESVARQTDLGEWILRKVFQLKEYEVLTHERLDELGINGIRVQKYKGSNSIHLHFIWIDDDHLPDDYWG